MTFECQCPERGQCPIHKKWMSAREHQICQGVNVLNAVRNKSLSAWQKAAQEIDVPQPSHGIGDVIAKAIKTATLGLVKPCGGCQKRQAALNQAFPMGDVPLVTAPIDREMLVKHLIWPLLPLGGALSWAWRKHAKKLREIAPKFNGRKTIAVGVPGKKDNWFYRNYQQIIEDVHDWCDRLPQISAVSGIPRSGILPAALIAMRRNIPLLPIESLTGGRGPQKTTRRPTNHPVGPVLVVDDTSWLGDSIRKQQLLMFGKNVIFGALYASQHQSEKLDTFGYLLPTPLHTFEYNFMRDVLTSNFVIDFDGVLCDDWDGRNEDQHPEEYKAFLLSSPPKPFQPKFPVKVIVSGRLGKYRQESEQWLVNHGVRYGELIFPFQTLEERSRGSIAAEKAKVYQRYPDATLFVESSASQAAEIFQMTDRPVFCTDTMTLLQ